MFKRFGNAAPKEPVAKSYASRTPGLNRVAQSYRRRIDDVLEDAFRHACLIGDMDIAADLVGVVERAAARRATSSFQERRSANQHLLRMQAELAARQDGRFNGSVS